MVIQHVFGDAAVLTSVLLTLFFAFKQVSFFKGLARHLNDFDGGGGGNEK